MQPASSVEPDPFPVLPGPAAAPESTKSADKSGAKFMCLSSLTYQRFGLQNKFKTILSTEIALEWVSRADLGCNWHCKTNPVDLEGSLGQVWVVWGGFWLALGGGGQHQLKIAAKAPLR